MAATSHKFSKMLLSRTRESTSFIAASIFPSVLSDKYIVQMQQIRDRVQYGIFGNQGSIFISILILQTFKFDKFSEFYRKDIVSPI